MLHEANVRAATRPASGEMRRGCGDDTSELSTVKAEIQERVRQFGAFAFLRAPSIPGKRRAKRTRRFDVYVMAKSARSRVTTTLAVTPTTVIP